MSSNAAPDAVGGDLDELIAAIGEGIAALAGRTGKIPVDEAERAAIRLGKALTYAESLKASADFAASMDLHAILSHEDHVRSVAAEAVAIAAPFPETAALLAARDDLMEELAASNPEDGEDPEIAIDGSNAETLVRLLEGGARSAATPIEVAVVVRRGMVEAVRFDATDPRPVKVHVLDEDVEGATSAPNVAHLSDDDGFPTPAFLSSYERNGDDASPIAHAWWSTLRAETTRIHDNIA